MIYSSIILQRQFYHFQDLIGPYRLSLLHILLLNVFLAPLIFYNIISSYGNHRDAGIQYRYYYNSRNTDFDDGSYPSPEPNSTPCSILLLIGTDPYHHKQKQYYSRLILAPNLILRVTSFWSIGSTWNGIVHRDRGFHLGVIGQCYLI